MPVNVNVPCQVTIALDGTVSIQTIKTEQYNLAPADATFSAPLRDAILDAFVVSNNEGSEVANIAVDICGNSAIVNAAIAALSAQLVLAHKGEEPEEADDMITLKQYLMDFAATQLNKQLATNGIADTLEADAVENGIDLPDFVEDMSGGSSSMFDGVGALTPSVRALLATQINSSKWESASTKQSELPLKDSNDSLTFQFIITQHYAVSETAKANYDGSGNIQGVGPGVAPTHYTVETRTVDLVLVRPDPSGNASDSYPNDWTASAVTDAQAAVGQALTDLSGAMTAAKDAFTAWADKKALVDAVAAALKYKEKADDIYTKAQAVETAAVIAQGTMRTGPLHLAAVDAIAAAAKALSNKIQAAADYTTAVGANNDSSIPLATRRGDLDGANSNVFTMQFDYKEAVKTFNETKSSNSKEDAFVSFLTEKFAAQCESTLTHLANCTARYNEATAALVAATEAGSDLAVAYGKCVTDEADYVTKHGIASDLEAALSTSSTETEVDAARLAKKNENDAAIQLRDSVAAADVLAAAAQKLVDNINDKLVSNGEDAQNWASGVDGAPSPPFDFATVPDIDAYTVAAIYYPYSPPAIIPA